MMQTNTFHLTVIHEKLATLLDNKFHLIRNLKVQYYYFYSKTNQMHQCIKFILFWNDTLHVSGGLSVHHQEFKTVHTATGICQTVNPEMGKITSECVYML